MHKKGCCGSPVFPSFQWILQPISGNAIFYQWGNLLKRTRFLDTWVPQNHDRLFLGHRSTLRHQSSFIVRWHLSNVRRFLLQYSVLKKCKYGEKTLYTISVNPGLTRVHNRVTRTFETEQDCRSYRTCPWIKFIYLNNR
jgi:hypothetical protein